MEAATKPVTRENISEEAKWDLSGLYPQEDSWQTDFGQLEKDVSGFEQFRGTLGDSAAQVKACLEFDMEISRRHRLSTTLGELNRERLFQRVVLRGLDQEDVGRFIELVSGVHPPLGMVEAVHRQTEGNPLFVTSRSWWLACHSSVRQRPTRPRCFSNTTFANARSEIVSRFLYILLNRAPWVSQAPRCPPGSGTWSSSAASTITLSI